MALLLLLVSEHSKVIIIAYKLISVISDVSVGTEVPIVAWSRK
jgi:hypothetical protein